MNFSLHRKLMRNIAEYLISVLILNSHNYNTYGDKISGTWKIEASWEGLKSEKPPRTAVANGFKGEKRGELTWEKSVSGTEVKRTT